MKFNNRIIFRKKYREFIHGNSKFLLPAVLSTLFMLVVIFLNMWSVFFFTVFFMIIVIVGYRTKDKTLLSILLFAFFLRLFFLVLYNLGLNLPDSNGDARSFQILGWEAIKNISIFAKVRLYPKIIALIYFVTGQTTSVVSLLNVFFGSLVVVNIYYTSLFLTNNRKAAGRSALTAALFPSFILYSVLTLREMPAIFFVSLSFLKFLEWLRRNNINDFVWGSVFVVIAVFFHGAFFLILPGYVVLLIYLLARKQKYRKSFSIIIIIIFIVLLYILFPVFPHKVPVTSVLKGGFSYLDIVLNKAARGGSAYLKNFYPHSIFDLVWMTPVRMFYFLFGPFFWTIHKAIDLFGVIDSMCYIILFCFALKGINFIKRSNVIKESKRILIFFVLITFFTVWIGLSWGTSNFGTAIRHRTFLAWMMFPFATFPLKMQ